MPKLPRTSAKRIVSVLETLGFTMVRQRGSHMIFRRSIRGCVVPKHKDVAVGTLSGILRQAGVTGEEFMEVYENQ
jgi:predicted RNA binding protein YcfA (HicA-like mRNA interferase family)